MIHSFSGSNLVKNIYVYYSEQTGELFVFFSLLSALILSFLLPSQPL